MKLYSARLAKLLAVLSLSAFLPSIVQAASNVTLNTAATSGGNFNGASPNIFTPTAATAVANLDTVDTSGEEPLLRVVFLRRKGSGLIYTAERATTLDDFAPMTGNQTITSINAEWERVTVVETSPPVGGTRGFARVRVTLP